MLTLCRINVRRPHLLTFRADDVVIAGDRDHAMKMRVGDRRITKYIFYDKIIVRRKILSGRETRLKSLECSVKPYLGLWSSGDYYIILYHL